MALELADRQVEEVASSDARRARVLVLDDNPIDIEMVARCLRRFDGWDIDVIGCQTVDQAIDESAGGDIDLMFLDYWLHHETGLSALERMRAKGLNVPTILMTGMRGEAVLVEALQAGVVDYLPKSAIKPAAVQRAAKNAIEKSELARAVRQKQAALVETIQRLEERNREIGSFYHNVSHELKTPLTGAREFVSLVIDGAAGDINDSQRDLLTASLRSCDQMVTCINDMLDAARIETGKLSFTPADEDLRAVVDDAVMSLRGSATDAGIELVTSVPQEPVTLCIDPQRVFQVVSNLVTNAIKFSPRSSEVRVEVERAEGGATVRVIDHGRGLEPGTEQNVFDRLYQSKKEDAATLGGLGMGLYICREIVHLHGGEISVTSQPGEGCTFTFELPRHVQHSECTES